MLLGLLGIGCRVCVGIIEIGCCGEVFDNGDIMIDLSVLWFCCR